MATKQKEYSNGEVTVIWKPEICIHSENCFRGLPEVFDPKARPWIDAEGASTKAIVEQIKKCPSGALSYRMDDDHKDPSAESSSVESETIVEVIENGPLMVYGKLKVTNKDGSEEIKHKTTAFCRCGGSHNKPYCDGTHTKIGFEG